MTSIIMTSWDRFDLMQRSIESFLRTDDYDFDDFVVRNDSKALPDYDYTEFGVRIFSGTEYIDGHIGQVRSLDTLMGMVGSEYVLTLEDDWECIESGGIEEAISILESNPKCASVSLRGKSSSAHNGHPCELINGYWRMNPSWNGWTGWSYAPSLRRRSDYIPYNSIAQFNPKVPWEAERKIGQFMTKGKWCATTEKQYFRHIGGDNSTFNFGK